MTIPVILIGEYVQTTAVFYMHCFLSGLLAFKALELCFGFLCESGGV